VPKLAGQISVQFDADDATQAAAQSRRLEVLVEDLRQIYPSATLRIIRLRKRSILGLSRAPQDGTPTARPQARRA
jgi:hypothetical protein